MLYDIITNLLGKNMDKVETIKRHVAGKPNLGSKVLTWVEFVAEVKPEDEAEMNKYAIALLNGDFLFSKDFKYTYFINGLNPRDKEQ